MLSVRIAHWTTLARHSLALYALLIVYTSLYPFSGWHSTGLSVFAWLNAPFPRYITAIDLLSNVLGYIPLGLFFALSLRPNCATWLTVFLSSLASAGLSASMESLQTWLPQRVPSYLDLACNTLGALCGVRLGLLLYTHCLQKQSTHTHKEATWFTTPAGFGLTLTLLWPFAQIFPQAWLFGSGAWLQPWRVPEFITISPLVHEIMVCSMACLNVGLLASLSMRPRWPRFVFPIVLFGFTLLLKWAITSAQFSSLHALDWLTEGAYLGLLLGGIFLFFALFFSESNRRTIALVAIILVLIMIHIMPINPYYIDVLKNWRHGNWQQFDHVMQWLAQIWPYLALVYLLTKRPR